MVGPDGRWNLGADATYHAGKATYSFSAGAQHGVQPYDGTVRREASTPPTT